MAIFWLGDQGCHDPVVVGGKAAALSRLAADHPVPPGFCLGALTGGAALTPQMEATIAAAYQALGCRYGTADPPVAVRSSAVGEDGATASFAGQFESYLNICGSAAVLAAIRRCLDSAQAARIGTYRQQQGLGEAAQPVAVLVQALVIADASAVVFSADPRTGDRGQLVITATWGLGESLVGGTVTPDTWTLRKSDLAISNFAAGDNARMTVAIPGGTREVTTPRFLRDRPTLDPAQVADLARLALTLETTAGHPVDLECAFTDERLHLLQCRPITTLAGTARASSPQPQPRWEAHSRRGMPMD
jgi:phosphoenolpyruvate synthase/pyruvate phosphate dikinase